MGKRRQGGCKSGIGRPAGKGARKASRLQEWGREAGIGRRVRKARWLQGRDREAGR